MKLLDQVRVVLRKKHYSYRTEKTYVHWIKRYIYFNDMKHPKEEQGDITWMRVYYRRPSGLRGERPGYQNRSALTLFAIVLPPIYPNVA